MGGGACPIFRHCLTSRVIVAAATKKEKLKVQGF